ncbi:MAG: ECF transporter S component [Ruminiclostridium sp.]|nr:ECF transporter S component [Ruminiclostridium sp.]
MENTQVKAAETLKAPTANRETRRNYITTIVGMGLMTAIVVVLQVFAASIKLGEFSITLTLAPIVIGAALFGPLAGAWLGLVFGAVVLLSGDAAPFMEISVAGTIITVLLKGALSGLAAGFIYHLIQKKNKYAAVVSAGIAAPIVNTGVFVLGVFAFFFGTISEWAEGAGMGAVQFIFVGLIGLNFFVELGINLVLSSVIVTILNYANKMINNNR